MQWLRVPIPARPSPASTGMPINELGRMLRREGLGGDMVGEAAGGQAGRPVDPISQTTASRRYPTIDPEKRSRGARGNRPRPRISGMPAWPNGWSVLNRFATTQQLRHSRLAERLDPFRTMMGDRLRAHEAVMELGRHRRPLVPTAELTGGAPSAASHFNRNRLELHSICPGPRHVGFDAHRRYMPSVLGVLGTY